MSYHQYHQQLRAKAEQVRGWSPDPSTKVGCVVASPDGLVQGVGANRFPAGIPPEWMGDRSLKLKAVVHAEMEAICNAGNGAQGGILYCTAHPCRECAKLIIQAGIVVVHCPEGPWRDDPEVVASVRDAAELMARCGVVRGRGMPTDQMMLARAWCHAGVADEKLLRATTLAAQAGSQSEIEDLIEEARVNLRAALKELGPE